jgi:hyperosmotically inducible protein
MMLAVALLAVPLTVAAADKSAKTSVNSAAVGAPTTNVEKAVRHQLVMLPYYNLFDDLSFRVDAENHVTLMGAVTRPTLKSDAQNVVKRVEGVTGVTNDIKVLPLSPMDDRIRIAEYRAIYGYGPLQRYSMGALPSIHIIVDNGHVTLEGVVANEADRNMANIRANQVFGVFSVTNDLRVERKG